MLNRCDSRQGMRATIKHLKNMIIFWSKSLFGCTEKDAMGIMKMITSLTFCSLLKKHFLIGSIRMWNCISGEDSGSPTATHLALTGSEKVLQGTIVHGQEETGMS